MWIKLQHKRVNLRSVDEYFCRGKNLHLIREEGDVFVVDFDTEEDALEATRNIDAILDSEGLLLDLGMYFYNRRHR